MTLSANFTSKSVFDQQGCRALTFALARLSCFEFVSCVSLRTSIGYNMLVAVDFTEFYRAVLHCVGLTTIIIVVVVVITVCVVVAGVFFRSVSFCYYTKLYIAS